MVQAHQRVEDVFARSEVRQRGLAYLEGLLSGCEPEEQLAGSGVGRGSIALCDAVSTGSGPLGRRCGSGAPQRVCEGRAGQPGCGRWYWTKTGFLKKGVHSAGVQRQYSGTAGRIENSQVGVFLCYASQRGYVLLDRELYLPQSWAEDGARRRAAGIPDEIEFQTKPMLGKRMLERAFQAGMPCGWVAGDEVYGHDSKLRRWLEERQQPYVLAVAADQRLWRSDLRQHRIDEIAGQLPKRSWKRLSADHGAKGERLYDWALLPWAEQEGWEHALLVRRSLEAKPEYAFYFSYAPKKQSTLKTLVGVAGQRWAVEIAFQMAKGECGLDHYEVRHWRGWYRHITLSMLALAVLAVLRAREKKTFRQKGSPQRTGNPAFARFRAARRLARPGASAALV